MEESPMGSGELSMVTNAIPEIGVDAAAKPTNLIRWIHLSDFHVGKGGYGQSRLFKYILAHIQPRGSWPSPQIWCLSPVTLPIRATPRNTKSSTRDFFLATFMTVCLPMVQDVLIVPGNHDVDRTQARAVQTYDALLRVPQLLDPTEQGQFERRQSIFPALPGVCRERLDLFR